MSMDLGLPHCAERDREQLVSEIFVVLARAGDDTGERLDILVLACVNLLGSAAAGLLLTSSRGGPVVSASSTERVQALLENQVRLGRGPGPECVSSGTTVTVDDLSRAADRWPQFAPAAVRDGFGSVVAIPVSWRDRTIGALALLGVPGRPLSPRAHHLARAFADTLAIAVLRERSGRESAVLTEQLQRALDSRIVIEQAKGMLAERHDTDMASAFEALRGFSRNHNRKLAEISAALVAGALDLDAVRQR